jgi:hypothetical protein
VLTLDVLERFSLELLLYISVHRVYQIVNLVKYLALSLYHLLVLLRINMRSEVFEVFVTDPTSFVLRDWSFDII